MIGRASVAGDMTDDLGASETCECIGWGTDVDSSGSTSPMISY